MTTDNNYLSKKWASFRLVWWLVTLALILSLFLIWVTGHGPRGTGCGEADSVSKLSPSSNAKAPIITLKENATLNLVAGDEYTEHGATAMDEVDGELQVDVSGKVDTKTAGEYEVTYSVKDSDGNTATQVRKVIVSPFVDTEVPEIFLVGSKVTNIKVDALYVDDGAIATDIPDGELEVVTEGKVNTSKPGEYIIKYSATDKAGNTSMRSRTVIVSEPDNDEPVITLEGESEVRLTIGDSYKDAGANAVDISDGKLDVTVSGEVDTTTAGEYLIKYNVSDIAGNKAEEVRKVIVMEPDSLPPVITLNGEQILDIKVGDTYDELGATGEDSIDGEVDVLTSGKVQTDKAGEYIIIYTARDRSGNLAEEKRFVTVEEVDVDAPVINLIGDAQMNIQAGEKYIEPGFKAEDAIDGDVVVNVTGEVLSGAVGEYTLVYSAKDKTGNVSEVTRTVHVKEDDVDAPTITLVGESIVNLKQGMPYEEAGATSSDAVDGELTVSISGDVDTNTPGEYSVLYSTIDKAGNSKEMRRSVIVEAVDKEPPTITLNGESALSLKLGEAYEEKGAKAIDDVDGELEINISGQVDIDKPGTYELVYSVADKLGNSSKEVRQVNIEEPVVASVDETKDQKGDENRIEDKVIKAKLYFEYGKATNPMSNDGSFAKVINHLMNNASSKANVYGFYDASSNLNNNIELAKKRAESVSSILRGAGISSNRLTVKKPVEAVETGSSDEARRVEVDVR